MQLQRGIVHIHGYNRCIGSGLGSVTMCTLGRLEYGKGCISALCPRVKLLNFGLARCFIRCCVPSIRCVSVRANYFRPGSVHVSNKVGDCHVVLKSTAKTFCGSNISSRDSQLRDWRLNAADEDDFDVEDAVDFEMDRPELGDDDEDDFRDYETEYESPTGYSTLSGESDSFVNTEGEEEESVVDWKINEEEFQKISLLTCDFFIRKVPDPDGDVYDFREMYVTSPDTDVYSIPTVVGTMPKKPIRCTLSKYEYINTSEPPVDQPRGPLYKTEMEVMKVFLTKHLRNKRAEDDDFVLDFEEIYVIDTVKKSISRAPVVVDVPGGKHRSRINDVLIVRDDGTSFRVVLEGEQSTPDEVVGQLQWDRSRENMENYLRGFRDYEISNWF